MFDGAMQKVMMQAGLQALRSSKMVSESLAAELAELATGDYEDVELTEGFTIAPGQTGTRLRMRKGSDLVTVLVFRGPKPLDVAAIDAVEPHQ